MMLELSTAELEVLQMALSGLIDGASYSWEIDALPAAGALLDRIEAALP